MKVIAGIASLPKLVGSELGVSKWLTIDQGRIDRFADLTDDRQWLHTDPIRAAGGPYGQTIVHGYLTLALLPALTASAFQVDGVVARVNYGLERVRFPAPLPSGLRVRDRATLTSVEPIDGGVRILVRNTIEAAGINRPVCVADTLTLLLTKEIQ